MNMVTNIETQKCRVNLFRAGKTLKVKNPTGEYRFTVSLPRAGKTLNAKGSWIKMKEGQKP